MPEGEGAPRTNPLVIAHTCAALFAAASLTRMSCAAATFSGLPAQVFSVVDCRHHASEHRDAQLLAG